MLEENFTPERRQSALERRVAMGLDQPRQRSVDDIDADLEELIVDGDDE